jgi:hypothetical protein
MRVYRGVFAGLLVLASAAWALFHLAAKLDDEGGTHRWLVDPIWMGFLTALPVIWVRRYSIRFLWSTTLPLTVYLLLILAINPHPGFPIRIDLALLFMLGGACSAQVRSGWEVAGNYRNDRTSSQRRAIGQQRLKAIGPLAARVPSFDRDQPEPPLNV